MIYRAATEFFHCIYGQEYPTAFFDRRDREHRQARLELKRFPNPQCYVSPDEC